MAFERALVADLDQALRARRGPPLIHVVTGPRQVGKTTVALAVARRWEGPSRYAAADEIFPPSAAWLATQWELGRRDAGEGRALLVLDEVQKVPGWSEIVKGLWDADRRARRRLDVILLGSSALLLGAGAGESLAGRFRRHRCMHWSHPECRRAFGWGLERFLYFGGYPGAAPLAREPAAWRAYVRDSLIEATLARDVLSLERVTKPALLRHLFALACHFAGQPLSYSKMLGQLHDAGNTTTLAHYIRLLEAAYLVSGLERFSAGKARSRGSSPKLAVWNNALVTAIGSHPFAAARADGGVWGRLVENGVAAHLLNGLCGSDVEITWWREGAAEVDFVLAHGARVLAIEVKSGRGRGAGARQGLDVFLHRHRGARGLIVGTGGLPLEELFATDPRELLDA